MNNKTRQFVLLLVLLPALQLSAQVSARSGRFLDKVFYEKQGGMVSLGVRSTVSLFNHGDPKEIGTGVGGHFRIQVVDRVNTEFYADVLPANIHNKAQRMDYHIGWSVMYYLINTHGFKRKFTPYVVTGHCFDWTHIKINGPEGESRTKFSSAIQAGIGCSYNVTPRFDISLTTQYMFHLGKELHAEEQPDGHIALEEHKNAGWEGHLLLSISVNYKIFKLWNRNR